MCVICLWGVDCDERCFSIEVYGFENLINKYSNQNQSKYSSQQKNVFK